MLEFNQISTSKLGHIMHSLEQANHLQSAKYKWTVKQVNKHLIEITIRLPEAYGGTTSALTNDKINLRPTEKNRITISEDCYDETFDLGANIANNPSNRHNEVTSFTSSLKLAENLIQRLNRMVNDASAKSHRQSPLIDKHLLASNPLKSITVVVEAYYDYYPNCYRREHPNFLTFTMPTASIHNPIIPNASKSHDPYPGLLNVTEYNAFHQTISSSYLFAEHHWVSFILGQPSLINEFRILDHESAELKHAIPTLKNSQGSVWQDSEQYWSNWASVRHAITTERNYLASLDKPRGFFSIKAYGKPVKSHIKNSWYQVLSPNKNDSLNRARILPTKSWLPLPKLNRMAL